MAIECLSSICATDFKASEIELGISSLSPDEKHVEGQDGRFRQMDERERDEWLIKVGEKD